MARTIAHPTGAAPDTPVHQTLDVLSVEVGLQCGNSSGRNRRQFATRRTFDLVAKLRNVLTQTVLAEGVVTWQELGLVIVVVEETATDEAHEYVLVALMSSARSLHLF